MNPNIISPSAALRMLQRYDAHAEIGITYHEEEIYIANWNRVPAQFCRYLERFADVAYHDEIVTDSRGRAHRDNDQTFVWWDGEAVGVDDLAADGDLAEYVRETLADNYNSALSVPELVRRLPSIAERISDPDEYEHGFYGIQDSPESAMRAAHQEGYSNVFFAITDATPFRVSFEMWSLKDE